MMETSEAGRSRQDIGVEGDISTIMNIAYYLEFLDRRAGAGAGEATGRAAGVATAGRTPSAATESTTERAVAVGEATGAVRAGEVVEAGLL